MMATPNKICTALLVTITMLMASSCKKEILTTKTATDSTIGSAETRKMTEALLEMAFPGNGDAMSFKTDNFACEVITVDSSSLPYTKIYDYGTGCTDPSGEFRKGIRIETYNSEDYLIPGTKIEIAFSNYFTNDGEFRGNVTIENTGINGNGNIVISLLGNCQLVRPAGGPIQLDVQQFYEWTAGSSTSQFADDIFSVTGFYHATATNGDQCLIDVTQPLIRKRDPACKKFYVQGILHTQTTGSPDEYLDYGDGTCDDQAVQTINGVPQTITLQ